MSSDCSDDDMPDLESVSSSEYMSDERDLSVEDDYIDGSLKGEHYQIALRWLEQDKTTIDKQVDIIAVYLYSPVMYGHAHQSDKWLKWCQEAGLLLSDTNYNTGCLSDRERQVIDLLDLALHYCRNIMKDRTSPDELTTLLKLASDIQEKQKELSYEEAVKMAEQSSWFIVMVDTVKENPIQVKGTVMSEYPLITEVGCLYAVNQTAEHVVKFVKEDRDFCKEFQDRVQSDEEMGEQLKKNGDDLVKADKHKEAVEEYCTAIPCFPYNYKLYTNRALAYMELNDFRSSLSDGLRATILNPAFSKGYIRYIVALKACGETTMLQRVSSEYHKRFPAAKDRELLKKALASQAEKLNPSQEDRNMFENLQGMCRRGSESYLDKNTRNASLFFEQAQLLVLRDKGWKNCLSATDWKRYAISVHFAYGLSLLENGSQGSAEMALREFQTILDQYRSMHFVPAHWGAARALVLLGRHSHALLTARNGLEQLPLVKLPTNPTWPGTETIMSEALLQNVEANLQEICENCEPACVPDAICRYSNCTPYHKSSNIRIVSEDYKGHVLLVCFENCSIAYHPACWKRFKYDNDINSDRDFVLTPCPTPDCYGKVSSVSVFDLKGNCKIKFEPPASKAGSHSIDPSTAYQGKKKSKKMNSKSKGEHSFVKRLRSESGSSDSCKEAQSKKSNSDGSSAEGSVCSEEGVARKSSVPGSEDARKPEDTVEIINRQAEVDEEQSKESPKSKSKKKKEKKTLAKEQLGFEYSDRGALADAGAEESKTKVPKWVPDEEAPFQAPEHLREAIEQFENKEVPSMGLVPRPPIINKKQSEEFEYIFSYFRELFKNYGGLHPTDPVLTNALVLLPEDKKGLVEASGGLESFLLMSPSFKSHGELICLFEDAPVIAASINSLEDSTVNSGNRSSQNGDVEKSTKRKKTLKKDKKSSQIHSSSDVRESMKSDMNALDDNKACNGTKTSGGVPSPVLSRLTSPVSVKTRSRLGSASSLKDGGDNLVSEPLPRPKSEKNAKSKEKSKENGIDYIEKTGLGEHSKSPHDQYKKMNGVDKDVSKEKLKMSDWDRQMKEAKVNSELVTFSGHRELWRDQKPVFPVKMASVGVSACPVVKNKGVMVDLIPPVESFKDRYESVLKEKEDLQFKLESSEDQKFKMQRDHKRELDKVQKQSQLEAKESYQARIDELERRVSEEKDKLGVEKKEHTELTRSLKTEIKSLTDKIDRIKKDSVRKERQHDSNLIQARADLEHAQSEKRKMEDRLKSQGEQGQKTLRRAMEAEVELLNMRREGVVRPVEQRLREVESILMSLPKENEFHREWENFRNKLKTSLDSFMNAMDDQIKQVRAGKLISQLDRVPTPPATLPPQLAAFRMPFMRPPFMPMMVRHPNMPPPPVFDPLMPRPPIPTTLGGGGVLLPPTGPAPPGSLTQSAAAVGSSGALPSGGQQSNLFNDPSPGSQPESEVATGSRKISSFDRIVEKLAPDYPHCNKGDFKMVLREVRRNNRNSLSGLSLDNITSQIRAILDSRSGRVTSPTSGVAAATSPLATNKSLAVGSAVSGKGKRRQAAKTQPAVSKKSMSVVAVAEPPKASEVEYDNDGSCIICYEDMTDEDSSTLNCGHIFHSECIRSWFNEQSTCPTCRNHSLLPDEYPTLK